MHLRRSEKSIKKESIKNGNDIDYIILNKELNEDEKYSLIANILQDNNNKYVISKKYMLHSGETLLHLAAKCGLTKVVQLLIAHGANVHAVDDNKFTAMHYAGKRNIIQLLKEKDAQINFDNIMNPLHVNVQNNMLENVAFLLELNAHVNAKDDHQCIPLHYATNFEIAKILIEYGADIKTVNEEGLTTLHMAVKNKAVDVASLLIEKRVNVNAKDKKGFISLHYAQDSTMIDLLCAAGACINSNKKELSPLHFAVQNNLPDVVDSLIKQGADIEAVDINLCTPLHYSAKRNFPLCAKLLLQAGAKISVKDIFKATPLHYAAEKNSFEIAMLLIDLGADINAMDKNNWTPIFYASSAGFEKMLLWLCYRGGDWTIGSSALIEAVNNNHPRCVSVLIAASPASKVLFRPTSLPLLRSGSTSPPLDQSIFRSKSKNLVRPESQSLSRIKPRATSRPMAQSLPQPRSFSSKHEILIKAGQDLMLAKHSEDALEKMISAFNSLPGTLDLHAIVKNNYWQGLLMYIENDLPLNIRDQDNCTPIHYATQAASLDILLTLSKQPGIDLNVLDKNNESLLHKCVRNNNIKGLKILVTCEKPINRYYRNLKGKRAEDLIDKSIGWAEELRTALVTLPAFKRTTEYQIQFYKQHPDYKLIDEFKALPLFKDLELAKLTVFQEKNYSNEMKRGTLDDYNILIHEVKQIKENFDLKMLKIEQQLQPALLSHGLDDVLPLSEVKPVNFSALIASFPKDVLKDLIDAEGLEIIYGLCSGLKRGEKLCLDIPSIKLSSIGLLNYYPLPSTIISALIILYPHFSNHQNLIGHYIVFNAIKACHFLDLDAINLNLKHNLQVYIKECCLKDVALLFTHLQETIEYLYLSEYKKFKDNMIHEEPLKSQKGFTACIEKIVAQKDRISIRDVKKITEEIHQLSLGFYQKASFSNLINEKISNNPLINQLDILNTLPRYILHFILRQKKMSSRVKAIALFSLVAQECFNIEDLHSLTIIMSALASSRLLRLTQTFEYMEQKNPKIFKLFNLMQRWIKYELLNYKGSRALREMYPMIIPCLGLPRHDYIFVDSKKCKFDRIFGFGKIFSKLIDLRNKSKIEFFQFTNKTNLFFELINDHIPNEDKLLKMSFCLEPLIPILTNDLKIDEFQAQLLQIQEYELPLKVISKAKCYEGKEALPIIQKWLIKLQKKTNIDDVFMNSTYNECKAMVDDRVPLLKRKDSLRKLSFFAKSALPGSLPKNDESNQENRP